MRKWIILLILMAFPASSTVEDMGGSTTGTGGMWPVPSLPSLPASPPVICPDSSGCLRVSVDLTGPQTEQDKGYITQGKTLEFIVNVKNEGHSDVEAELSVSSDDASPDWFSWTSKTLKIPSGAARSEKLLVRPDINAIAGSYNFDVGASAKCYRSGQAHGFFKVQDYDYASESAISGTGQFQVNKDISSMNSGIKSDKNIVFSGSVDALVKNEYLVDQAKGRNANFEEQDAVDNYMALRPGDALFGSENFKSSAIFGGVGAKVLEAYNVQQMEAKSQDFNLYQTGSLGKLAEFKTADNFTGYYLIDAKQTKPGQKSLKEHEEYLGAFEINRRILFRDRPTFNTPCPDGTCFDIQKPSMSMPNMPKQNFTSPCLSGSCNDFVEGLNAFPKST